MQQVAMHPGHPRDASAGSGGSHGKSSCMAQGVARLGSVGHQQVAGHIDQRAERPTAAVRPLLQRGVERGRAPDPPQAVGGKHGTVGRQGHGLCEAHQC